MHRLVLVLFGFGLLAVPDVHAVSFTIDGSWSGSEGPGAGTVRNVFVASGTTQEDQMFWGQATSGSEQSGLGFTPTVETIVVSPGVPFELGQLTRMNRPIQGGSEITSADLTLSLVFDDPALALFTPTFSFAIGAPAVGGQTATCSNSGEAPCPDVISFPAAGATAVAGTPYSFTLLGFGDRMNGPLVDHFVTQAGHDGHTPLWGVFTEAPPPDASSLPEPTSLLLLGSGLGLLKLRRSRRPLPQA